MEQELTQANANLSGEPLPTKRVVNWGGVAKGAAIIGAVALVAVVALPAFTAIGSTITGAISASPAASSVAVGIGEAATWLGDSLLYGVSYVGGFLGELGNMALEGVGLAGKTWEGAAATTKAIGLAGAAATTAVAAHAAMPSIQTLQLGTDVPVDVPATSPSADQGLLAAQGAQGASVAHAAHHSILHDAAHAAHHAAEEADAQAEANEEQGKKNWASKFMHKSAAHASHSEAVRANQAPRTLPQPAASFGEQIAIDRANLESALAK